MKDGTKPRAPKPKSLLRQAMGNGYRCSEAAIRATMGSLPGQKQYETVQERTTKEKR